MPQSLAKLTIHLTFSTLNRKAYLRNSAFRNELCAYMATVLANNADSPAIIVNGHEDHVHALFTLSRKVPLMKVVQEAKSRTSRWAKQHPHGTAGFAWQAGYAAFSVSESNLLQVKQYIANQEEHHQRLTFQDEYRAICKKHGIEVDERYVWD